MGKEKYQSLLLGRSLFEVAGSRLLSPGALCRPSAWASLHVRPINDHDASAFMSFASTKPRMMSACSESSDGRRKKLESLRQWKEVWTVHISGTFGEVEPGRDISPKVCDVSTRL